MLPDIEFESGTSPSPEELIEFHRRQQHSAPLSREQMVRIIECTFCFITARQNGSLIGFARGVTDGLIGRIAECKLDPSFQGPACVTKTDGRIEHDSDGVATEMATRVIDALRAYGVLHIEVLAHSTETDFCAELGFRKMPGMVAMIAKVASELGENDSAPTRSTVEASVS